MSFPESGITSSVGWGGVNRPEDVRLVEALLSGFHDLDPTGSNRYQLTLDARKMMAGSKRVAPPPGSRDCDPALIGAIFTFEKRLHAQPQPGPRACRSPRPPQTSQSDAADVGADAAD